jgi:hypothetical protein
VRDPSLLADEMVAAGHQLADAAKQGDWSTVFTLLGNPAAPFPVMARQSATIDPARGIVDAAVAGELDNTRLHTLIAEAATERMIATTRANSIGTPSGC